MQRGAAGNCPLLWPSTKALFELEYDEFMGRSRFCAEFAATLTDLGEKSSLLEMAAQWRQLAEQAKALERT